MSFLDRFRKPVKYVLQAKKGKGFETLSEYDHKDYPIPPTEATCTDDMTDEDVYHRLVAIYPSGNNKVVWEHQGKRKTKEKAGRPAMSQLRDEVKKALEPLSEIGGMIEDINEALGSLRGSEEGGGGLTPEDVKQAIHEEMGGMGMNFQMPTPPGWIWMFHPWVRAGEKDIIDSVEGMFKRVGEHVVKAAMGETAGVAEKEVTLPSLASTLDEEIKAIQETPTTPPEDTVPPSTPETPKTPATQKRASRKKEKEPTDLDGDDQDEP